MFSKHKYATPDDRKQAARDEWESKFSVSECLTREEMDYLAEKVSWILVGDKFQWRNLKQWLQDRQEAHFIAWMESVDAENEYQQAEALASAREDRWMLA